jgi:hypothetical protein
LGSRPSLLGISENPSHGGAQDGAPDQMAISEQCPRSLQDGRYDKCRKEAQWGDRDNGSDGGSSAGVRALSINFFEDGSDSSSDLPDERQMTWVMQWDQKEFKSLYDFGSTRRPPPEISENTDLSGEKDKWRKPLECGGWSVFGYADPSWSESHEFDRLARTIRTWI